MLSCLISISSWRVFAICGRDSSRVAAACTALCCDCFNVAKIVSNWALARGSCSALACCSWTKCRTLCLLCSSLLKSLSISSALLAWSSLVWSIWKSFWACLARSRSASYWVTLSFNSATPSSHLICSLSVCKSALWVSASLRSDCSEALSSCSASTLNKAIPSRPACSWLSLASSSRLVSKTRSEMVAYISVPVIFSKISARSSALAFKNAEKLPWASKMERVNCWKSIRVNSMILSLVRDSLLSKMSSAPLFKCLSALLLILAISWVASCSLPSGLP